MTGMSQAAGAQRRKHSDGADSKRPGRSRPLPAGWGRAVTATLLVAALGIQVILRGLPACRQPLTRLHALGQAHAQAEGLLAMLVVDQ